MVIVVSATTPNYVSNAKAITIAIARHTLPSSRPQSVSFHALTYNQEMFVALNGKPFEPWLKDMTKPTDMVVRTITHSMSTTNPFHKPVHFTVEQWAKDEMKMVRHLLIAQQLNAVPTLRRESSRKR